MSLNFGLEYKMWVYYVWCEGIRVLVFMNCENK